MMINFKFYKYKMLWLAFVLSYISHIADGQTRTDQLVDLLRQPSSDYVFVVAHRGDWRHAPENSLQAIQNSIDMGADMVEIDVRLTKDSVFVLMHDDTIDRTTNGTGRVDQLTWSELQDLKLRDGLGSFTRHKIPTLEQALALTQDRILVNLDKGYDHIRPLCAYLKREGMLDQIVFKGWMKDYTSVLHDLDMPLDSVLFMPIVSLNEEGWDNVIETYKDQPPVAFEILFKREGDQQTACAMINDINARIWINSLWPEFNAGHHDDRAVYDPEGSYGWLLDMGATLIQTDRPRLLIDYLEVNNRR